MTREKSQNQRLGPGICCGLCGALVGMVLLASGGCELAWADNDTVIDVINATVPVACTISGSTDHTYSTSMLPDTTETLGPSHVKSVCNDVAGYSLYAIGFTGDSYTGDNTKLVGSLANINTGTSGPDSYWAMKAEAITGDYAPTIMNSFDNYHAIPADFTQVARFTSVTDGGTIGSHLDITYQVHASRTQTADTYTGKVKYVLVHPNDAPAPMTPLPESACSASQICYAPNTGDIDGSMSSMGTVAGSATAGKQTGVPTNGTAILRAPNFSREGYGFAGWSTEFDATTATNPVIYGPNQDITTSTTAGAGDADVSQHGLILYPVWIESAGSMQSDASTVCSNLTAASYNSTSGILTASLSSISALPDQRDGNTYAIAKLADGNCWMIENLRLNADDTLGDTNKALAQGYGTSTTYGNFTGLAPSEDANFTTTNPPVANSLYSTDGSTTNTIQGGNSSYYYARMPRYNNNNTNRSLTASYSGTGSSTYYQWYGYGNYYTWPAAIASVIEYTSATATVDNKTSETAGTSLCPTGWQLPYGRSTGNGALPKGFSYLDTQMGGSGTIADSSTTPTGAERSKMWRRFPNNFVYSGRFNTASAYNRSSYGYYWSSTAYNNDTSYYLYLYSSLLRPGTDNIDKYSGRSIRCLVSS